MKPVFALIMSAALVAMSLAPAAARQDDYDSRRVKLIALAGVLGASHHLKRTCTDPDDPDADSWRAQMQALIRIEEPPESDRDAMIGAFNASYRGAEMAFPTCDERAKEEARRLARYGEALVQELSSLLYQQGAFDEGRPTIWRGVTPDRDPT